MSDISQPRRRSEVLRHAKTPWTGVVLIPMSVAVLDPGQAVPVVTFAIDALLGTLPFIVVAVLLIAYLRAASAEAMIARAFEGREVQAICMAAVFGGLAPFCSCEVIPFIAGLLALGAPLSAVMAFWLSSPLIDPPTLLITAAALGWPFAIAKAAAAVALGLFGGFAIQALTSVGGFADPLRVRKVSRCGCGPSPFESRAQWRFWTEAERRGEFRLQFIENAAFLLKWLALAYVLEALLVTYVPAQVIVNLVGGEGPVPVILAALVGMPAYLNSYVAPPLLAGLVEQGMTLGAAMAFMVAGAVSSVPAMAAVWSLVKPQVFAAYLGLGVLGAVLAGLIFGAVI